MDLLYEFVRSEVLSKKVNDVIVLSPQRLDNFVDYLKSLGKSRKTVEGRVSYLLRLASGLG